MWTILLLFLGYLLVFCHTSSGCEMPTEDHPISICAFCSDSHAGVKWTVHESNKWKYPFGAYSLEINFHCSHSQSTITQDSCFRGDLYPGLTYIPDSSMWHWHILGQNLSLGTECVFSADIKNAYYRDFLQLSSSCTVQELDNQQEDLTMPAVCSSSDEESCPCQCSNGFKTDNIVNRILTCKNINECQMGTHSCRNTSNCVDTEGSYLCKNEQDLETLLEMNKNQKDPSEIIDPTLTTPDPTPTSMVSSTSSNTLSASLVIIPEFIAFETKDTSHFCTTTTSTITTCAVVTSATVSCYN